MSLCCSLAKEPTFLADELGVVRCLHASINDYVYVCVCVSVRVCVRVCMLVIFITRAFSSKYIIVYVTPHTIYFNCIRIYVTQSRLVDESSNPNNPLSCVYMFINDFMYVR